MAQITGCGGEPRRGRDVDDEGSHQSGVGNPGGYRDHGPDQQELVAGEGERGEEEQ